MSTADPAGDWFDEDLLRAAAHVHHMIDWLAAGTSPPVREMLADMRDLFLEPDYTVNQLKLNLGLKSNFYSTAFKAEVFGYTPGVLLRECRLLAAAYLLRDTTRPVLRITMDVGYNSETCFSGLFRKWCGLCPTAFRELARRLLRHSGAAPDEVLVWGRWQDLHRPELDAAVALMIIGIVQPIATELIGDHAIGDDPTENSSISVKIFTDK